MPSCCILVCGNRSNVTNYKMCGVTYHRFPKCAKLKKKWIKATGRDDWFPTQHSAICSSHFEEQSFLPSNKSRRLLPTAVPSIKLRLVFETHSTNTKENISTKKPVIKQNHRKTLVERYRIQIEKYKNAMKAQKLQIKRLRNLVRSYRMKVDDIKNIVNALKNEIVIDDDHLWLLECDNL